jgi:hypothetical protein
MDVGAMMDVFRQIAESPLLITLSVALFFCSAIGVCDARVFQGRRAGLLPPDQPNLPRWVGLFHFIYWGLLITLGILNWKAAILVWIVLFALKVSAILEIIGWAILRLFLPKHLKELRWQ